MNPQENLKLFWKIKRDMLNRNYDYKKVIENIQKRKKDEKYIIYQQENADLIISFKTNDEIDIENINVDFNPKIYLYVKLIQNVHINSLLENLIKHKWNFSYENNDLKYHCVYFYDVLEKQHLINLLLSFNINMKINYSNIKDGFDGIIQMLVLYVCHNLHKNNPILEYNPNNY